MKLVSSPALETKSAEQRTEGARQYERTAAVVGLQDDWSNADSEPSLCTRMVVGGVEVQDIRLSVTLSKWDLNWPTVTGRGIVSADSHLNNLRLS